MKECTRPHSLAHMVSGAGVALLVLYFVPSLLTYLLWGGVGLLVVGVAWDYISNPVAKK